MMDDNNVFINKAEIMRETQLDEGNLDVAMKYLEYIHAIEIAHIGTSLLIKCNTANHYIDYEGDMDGQTDEEDDGLPF